MFIFDIRNPDGPITDYTMTTIANTYILIFEEKKAYAAMRGRRR